MSDPKQQETGADVPREYYPQCLRCNKPVDSLIIVPPARGRGYVTVEYHCHGERVSQEMDPSVLTQPETLASNTAFNDYTSGLLPGKLPRGSA